MESDTSLYFNIILFTTNIKIKNVCHAVGGEKMIKGIYCIHKIEYRLYMVGHEHLRI